MHHGSDYVIRIPIFVFYGMPLAIPRLPHALPLGSAPARPARPRRRRPARLRRLRPPGCDGAEGKRAERERGRDKGEIKDIYLLGKVRFTPSNYRKNPIFNLQLRNRTT